MICKANYAVYCKLNYAESEAFLRGFQKSIRIFELILVKLFPEFGPPLGF